MPASPWSRIPVPANGVPYMPRTITHNHPNTKAEYLFLHPAAARAPSDPDFDIHYFRSKLDCFAGRAIAFPPEGKIKEVPHEEGPDRALRTGFPDVVSRHDIDQGKYELTGTTSFDFSSFLDRRRENAGSTDTTHPAEFDGNYYFQKNLALRRLLRIFRYRLDGGGMPPAGFIGAPRLHYNISIEEQRASHTMVS